MTGPCVEVRDEAGASAARLLARAVATDASLPPSVVETLAIIASELATNQWRYCRGGFVGARAISRSGVVGVEIEAVDAGPGIADVARAFSGEPTGGRSLGIGLAGVRRLALEVDVDTRDREGTRILARVFGGSVPRGLTVAIVGRGLASEAVSGDCAGFWRVGESLLVMLVDGLGHGELAREAANRAIEAADREPDSSPEALMAACAARLRGSRGAVVSIGRVPSAGGGPIEAASVGNVQMGVWTRGTVQRVVAQAGIVGASSLRPGRPAPPLPMPAGATLIMASDGVRDPFGDLETADVHALPPWALAQRILARRGKAHDDAMVLVVK